MSEFRVALRRPVLGIQVVTPKRLSKGRPAYRPMPRQPDHETVIAELEKTYQERTEAAYKNGVQDGTVMGLEQGRQEIQSAMDQLQSLVEGLAAYRETLSREIDTIVTQLSLSVAKMLIHREVAQDPDLILGVVREALRQVEDRRRLLIKVHPEDWEHVKGFEPQLREAMHGIREMEIKEDAQVRRGGCLIESDSGIVDARIDTQVEEIATGLLGAYG